MYNWLETGINAKILNATGKYWLSKSQIFQYITIGTDVNTPMLTKGETASMERM